MFRRVLVPLALLYSRFADVDGSLVEGLLFWGSVSAPVVWLVELVLPEDLVGAFVDVF